MFKIVEFDHLPFVDIQSLAQTKYDLFLRYTFIDSTNDNGNGSDARQRVAGGVWFIEWARQRIMVWLDTAESWGRGMVPV